MKIMHVRAHGLLVAVFKSLIVATAATLLVIFGTLSLALMLDFDATQALRVELGFGGLMLTMALSVVLAGEVMEDL